MAIGAAYTTVKLIFIIFDVRTNNERFIMFRFWLPVADLIAFFIPNIVSSSVLAVRPKNRPPRANYCTVHIDRNE